MTKFNILSIYREPSFSRKLTVAFTAVILVVAMTIPVAFIAFTKIKMSSAKAGDAMGTLQQVNKFQRSIGVMRVKARDFARTGNVADRNELATARNQMSDRARCLIKQARVCNDWRSLPEDEKLQWRKLIVQTDAIHQRFKGQMERNETQRGIEEFDVAIQKIEADAERLARRVDARGDEAQDEILIQITKSTGLLVLVLCAALAVATGLAWWVPRSLTRRLDDLRDTAHMIAGGDLRARVDDRRIGDDEIAELILDFNSMARSLQQRQEENVMLQQQLQNSLLTEQERATRDPLTTLRNHRYFQESLSAEIDRCRRSGSKVTIAVIDLDNFKSVNDRFGHHEGDAVLLRATKGISDNLRPYDLACRLGGEEFGVIFPETDGEEATVVMDRIAAHIVGFGPQGERLTFSGGLATFPVHSNTQADLYQRADEAAYTAKANGKAQTIIYDPARVVAMDSEERVRQRSREAVLNTATTLVSAVDQKDPYTRHHSELTAIYAATLARAMGMDEETVKLVYRCGLLHDVGKIGIADPILKKPGRLTPEEFDQIKLHPELSYRILQTADMEPVATWVRHHHEHWNGSGYPFGLSGEDIPLGSRIVLVADAFEAMTSDRVYRRALSTRQAIEELLGNKGTQFDPAIVDVMVDLVVSGIFDQVRLQYGRPVEQHDREMAAQIVATRTQPALEPGPASGSPSAQQPHQQQAVLSPYDDPVAPAAPSVAIPAGEWQPQPPVAAAPDPQVKQAPHVDPDPLPTIGLPEKPPPAPVPTPLPKAAPAPEAAPVHKPTTAPQFNFPSPKGFPGGDDDHQGSDHEAA